MAPNYRGSFMLGKVPMPHGADIAKWIVISCCAVVLGFCAGRIATAREAEPRLFPLVSSGQTVTGETIAYPVDAPAQVTAVILTLQPGEETGLHTHSVPVFGYVLEGELTVEYSDKSVRVFKPGDALLEAMAVAHNGRNTGQGPLRVVAVYMSAEGKIVSTPIKN